MPPLKGIDRGLNGEALKALEESGHGRRLAVVDASYNIPRWAQVVNYRGETSADALFGILDLVPVEGSVALMIPDGDDENRGRLDLEDRSSKPFFLEVQIAASLDHSSVDAENLDLVNVSRLDSEGQAGFYTIANNPQEDTLFVRTQDRLPYACATFIIGHMQVAE